MFMLVRSDGGLAAHERHIFNPDNEPHAADKESKATPAPAPRRVSSDCPDAFCLVRGDVWQTCGEVHAPITTVRMGPTNSPRRGRDLPLGGQRSNRVPSIDVA